MPGIDLSQISSNWKKLQASIQPDKKSSGEKLGTDHAHKSATNNLKRKRIASNKDGSFHAFKKPRSSTSQHNQKRPSRMGSTLSAPTAPIKTLVEDHDISPSDVTAAYGNGKSSSSSPVPLYLPSDTPNTGLHLSHKAGRYLALDCEMVGTGPPPSTDSILARVSVVNYNYEQIYDSYVLPPPNTRVTDYRTPISGILPSHLRPGVARPFAEVQAEIAKLLSNDRVLVGHALRNDFAVLGFGHPRSGTRDTSSWKPFRINGGAPRLRDLAKRELGVEIQSGEHSSLEDARAAMGLFRKVKREWEEEVRKRFGGRRVGGGKGKGKESVSSRKGMGRDEGEDVEDEEEGTEEEDEEDDWDLLEGEEEDDDEEGGGGGGGLGGEDLVRTKDKTASGNKKKRKKKKRTKRK